MSNNLTIVIPAAGLGTRMRPHTWSKPKLLVSLAGKTVLEHMLDMFKTLPGTMNVEYVFIVGPYLGELQIPEFMKKNYPELIVHYVVQTEMKGQSHALYQAREYLHGQIISTWADTLLETDFSFLDKEPGDGIAWVKPVPDPRRFGVAEVGKDGWISRLIEKQNDMTKNLALVGCYYFKDGESLVKAIETQMERKIMLKNEFFLVDAINLMIEEGARIHTNHSGVWLDTGTFDTVLGSNRYLLEILQPSSPHPDNLNVNAKVIPPVIIHPSATIHDSTIGPYASIGPNCNIDSSRIEDCIIDEGSSITRTALIHSIVGRNCIVEGHSNQQTLTLNIGDNSNIGIKT
jgi:glucose-1-phosphate thymidylyltransferase